MKKIFTVTLLLWAGVSLAQQTQPLAFNITGKIDNVKELSQVVLQYPKDNKLIKDTVPLVNGNFSLKGMINEPVKGTLSIIKANLSPNFAIAIGFGGEIIGRDGIALYLDEGNISIIGPTLKTAKVKGSVSHTDYEALQKELQPFYDKQKTISQKLNTLTPEQLKGPEREQIIAEVQAVFKEMTPVEDRFVKNHLTSYVSWNLIAGRGTINDPVAQKKLIYSFPEKFRNSKSGKGAIKRLEIAFNTAIGQPALEFTQNDTNGVPVSLTSLKGKYVLIDFWASWCGPCRAENPNLKKVYEKFKDKNFEILAVSLDDKKEAWLKAIADDRLPWLHVSDLKGWNNQVAALYNINAVPQNLLIDPNGLIIGKDLRGIDLERKISEIIK